MRFALERSTTVSKGKGKNMTDLKHKLIALFSALVIMAAAILVTGCKKEEGSEPAEPTPPAETVEEL